jgi:hypothetical protein
MGAKKATVAKPSTGTVTREDWLNRAVIAMRPWFTAQSLTVPPTVHVSIGWPSRSALSRRRQRLGECWHGETSSDKCPQLFISPTLTESSRILDVLLHEMLHTAMPVGEKHGRRFAKAAKELGLEGKPTATVAGEELKAKLNGLIAKLGAIPHAGLSATSQTKKQSTRLLKAECSDCGYIIRVTQKWIDDAGLPTCPCGTEFQQA